jgi:hypothetical protein
LFDWGDRDEADDAGLFSGRRGWSTMATAPRGGQGELNNVNDPSAVVIMYAGGSAA